MNLAGRSTGIFSARFKILKVSSGKIYTILLVQLCDLIASLKYVKSQFIQYSPPLCFPLVLIEGVQDPLLQGEPGIYRSINQSISF